MKGLRQKDVRNWCLALIFLACLVMKVLVEERLGFIMSNLGVQFLEVLAKIKSESIPFKNMKVQ